MTFTFKLEQTDGTPAEPPSFRSAVPNWRPGDWRQLRGLPVVAEGVQGAMFGSRPDSETIRRLDR
jgi:hypothetical protein